MTTRIAIVEDEPGIREALAAALEAAGLEVAAVFPDGEKAVDGIVDSKADVALVDLGLPGISGAETIRRMRSKVPELPVLVLTVFETPDAIVEAIEAGAAGYLLKGTPLAEVAEGLRQVESGLAPISPAVARHLLDRVRARERPKGNAPAVNLTPRERDVLGLLVGGHAYASVAKALGIRPGTVHTHVKSVYRKLEVASKAEAVAVAIRQGLVPDDG